MPDFRAREREPQPGCAFLSLGLLERHFLALEFCQFVIDGTHEMLTWRPCNPFFSNHDPLPGKRPR
jgi:hypothetical protein